MLIEEGAIPRRVHYWGRPPDSDPNFHDGIYKRTLREDESGSFPEL